jgi:hypothetical protein
MSSSNYTLREKQLISLPYDSLISVSIRFWLYLIPNILSILCSLFVLFHLLFNRILRQALNNHVIIILLFIGLTYELTSVPLMLYYYRFSSTWKLTFSFAHFWTFIDYLSYATQLIGFAWATIERHILIFHNQWVSTRKKRFFVHYFPLMTLFTYLLTYYFVLIFFPFCEDLIIPSPFNGVPIACFLFDQITLAYDTLSHQIIPTFIIIFMSSALLLRVLWQKSHLNRSIEWRKQRKMTIQLLSISILYLLFMGPRTLLQICLFIGLTTYSVLTLYMYSAFFANYIIFLFPFVCCGTIPELGKKLKKVFICRKQRQVIVPETLALGHRITL